MVYTLATTGLLQSAMMNHISGTDLYYEAESARYSTSHQRQEIESLRRRLNELGEMKEQKRSNDLQSIISYYYSR